MMMTKRTHVNQTTSNQISSAPRRSRRRRAVLSAACAAGSFAALALIGNVSTAHAGVQLFWDADGTAPVNGGDGNWNFALTPNWAVDSAGSAYQAWNNANGDIAVFGGTAGTISIANGTNVTAGGLQFDVTGYDLNALTNGSITLVGPATVNVTNNNSAIAGFFSGSAGLNKIGSGTLVLVGNNNYTGSTNVDGALQIDTGTSLPAGTALNISSSAGAALVLNNTTISVDSLTMSGLTSITSTSAVTVGTINVTGNGSVTLSGTALNGHADTFGSNLAGANLVFSNAPTFDVAAGGVSVMNGNILVPAGATLTKQGGGTLIFGIVGGAGSITSNYSAVVVKGGVLDIATDLSLGSVPASPMSNNVTLDGGTLRFFSNVTTGFALNANRGFNITANGGTLDFSQSSGTPSINFQISGTGTLHKDGARVVLSQVAQPNFSGRLEIDKGRWNVQADGAAGAGTVVLAAVSGAAATLGSGGNTATTVSLSDPVVLSTANGGTNSFEINSTGTMTLSGQISGTGPLLKGATAGTSGPLILTNTANNWTGDTQILLGSIKLGANGVIPDSSNVQVNSLLNVNGMTETIGGLLSTVSTGTVDLGTNGSLAFGASNTASLTFAGRIIGTGNVAKVGTGIETLTGSNTFTGTTIVQSGKLVLRPNAQPAVLTGGGADIEHGRILFDYAGGTDNAGTIQSLLTAAHASNFASGQFRSSTATSSKGLGWVDDTTNSQVNVAEALYGDSNIDGKVDLTDFTFLAANFNGSGKTWLQGDYNYDGNVDLTDFTFLAANFNQTLPSDGGGSSVGSMVPEPASMLSVSALAGSLILRRRRRA
jgi:fibronectin-binding autotransporter adhesin